jgi:AraC family transcriptional regulator of adaptative response/methylated-DNA-[protein]-cysteine methyltransferase
MSDYERIEQLIRYLDQHRHEQPNLSTLAQQVQLSPHHLHRLFSRWAGITPKSFLQSLTISHARELLRQGKSVLDASLDVGLSGPGRLHDLCVTLAAASPGEIKLQGANWTITAGFADSPFGKCVIAAGPRGICHLSFVDRRDRDVASAAIHRDWKLANIRWDDDFATESVGKIFAIGELSFREPLKAFVSGTEFQVRVWKALLQIPLGAVVSYGQVAERVGSRKASRAVGSAVGQNRLGYLIPCHRVIRETGVLGDYRWGSERKKSMLAWESAANRASAHNNASVSIARGGNDAC